MLFRSGREGGREEAGRKGVCLHCHPHCNGHSTRLVFREGRGQIYWTAMQPADDEMKRVDIAYGNYYENTVCP